MQQCSLTLPPALPLTISDNSSNTFLTSRAFDFVLPLRMVRNLLGIEDKPLFVSKENNIMRYQTATKANIVSSQVLARLAMGDNDLKFYTQPPTLISRAVVTGGARIFETVLLSAFGVIFWAVYINDFSAASVLRYLPVIGFAGFTIPLLMHVIGLFKVRAFMRFMQSVPKLAMIWGGVFASVFIVVFFTKLGASYSRLWLGGWAIGSFSVTLLFRAGLSAYLKNSSKAGQMDRRAVLVGGGEPALKLMKAFDAAPASDVSVIGVFDDRNNERSPSRIGRLKKLGTINELVEFARMTRVDMLIITLPLVAETRLLEILKQLWVLPVDIRLSAYSQKVRYKARAYSYIGNIPLLDVFDKPLSDWNALLKTIEDKVLAALALVVLAPVMGLVALAVKLDSSGPVIFRQKRYGFNNELIEVYKFRSMFIEQSDQKAEKLVTRNDPRVTKVGRFIRRTSLDELPQFINVLRGELSLVGPRPHATHAKAQNNLYTEVVDGYFARHRVKPGITGWAQINGWRGETDTKEKIERRVEHDLFYIENWSLLFDLYILAKTPFCLLETENAF